MKIVITECAHRDTAALLLEALASKETVDAFLEYAMDELPFMDIGVTIERKPGGGLWLRQYGNDCPDAAETLARIKKMPKQKRMLISDELEVKADIFEHELFVIM